MQKVSKKISRSIFICRWGVKTLENVRHLLLILNHPCGGANKFIYYRKLAVVVTKFVCFQV